MYMQAHMWGCSNCALASMRKGMNLPPAVSSAMSLNTTSCIFFPSRTTDAWPKICSYLTTSGLPFLNYLNGSHQLTLVHENSLLQHNCLDKMWKSHPQISSYTVTSLKLQHSKDLKNSGIAVACSTFQAWVYRGYREGKLLWSVKKAEHISKAQP